MADRGVPAPKLLETARGFYATRKPKPYSRKGCDDCGGVDEPYLVKNHVWQKSKKGKGFLCLSCLEHRIGRLLTLKDFHETAPISWGIFGFDVRFRYEK